MAVSKNAVAGGVAALGGTSAVGAGIYVATKEETKTIKDLIGSHAILNDAEFEKRFETKGTDTPPSEVNDKTKLKSWCENHYKTPVTKEIESNTTKIEEIKKWCTPTIKQKLSKTILLTETVNTKDDSEDWKIRSKNLKDYEVTEEEIKDISETRESITDPSSGTEWQKLRDWCKAKYKENFKGENDNLWKLVNKFCTKATIREALHGTELPEKDVDSDWTKKIEKAEATSDGTKDNTLKTDLTTHTNKKPETLKKWCKDQYEKDHDLKIGSTENKLLDEVKKLCSLTIKEKMDESSDENDKPLDATSAGNEDKWKKNAKKLTNYAEVNDKANLIQELKDMKKNNDTDGDKNKDNIKAWCKKTYEKGYKGENDQLYKLAKHFCNKKES